VCRDNDFELSSTVCEVPTSREDLSSILPATSAWDLDISDTLIKVCSKIDKPEPAEFSFIPAHWSHREDNYSEETSETCIRYHHLIEVASNQHHWLSNSQQRKLRLKEINNQRNLSGEIPIQLKGNCGKKDKERSKQRAIEWDRRHFLNW